MQDISRRYPKLVPAPLAVDTDRGWLLMPDFGGTPLVRIPDIHHWENALGVFARMQVEQVNQLDHWQTLGIPDRRLRRMVELTDPLIALSSQLLAGGETGFSPAEIEALRALSMKLKLLCAKLASYEIPQTLVHSDLGGNILVNGDQYIVFDWTDVCISHPFFEMTTIIDTVFDASVLHNRTDIRARLRDAYLEPWTVHASMERLIEAFELTKSLGTLHQAMSYMWILMNVAEDARWELENGLMIWLRHLLPSQLADGFSTPFI